MAQEVVYTCGCTSEETVPPKTCACKAAGDQITPALISQVFSEVNLQRLNAIERVSIYRFLSGLRGRHRDRE